MMLAQIVAKKTRGDVSGAAAEIEEQCLQHIGLPLILIKQSSPDAVAGLLASGGALRTTRAILLAELLLQDAELSELRGNPPEAVLSYSHAQRLLADVVGALNPDEQAHYRDQLANIAAKLRDLGGDSLANRANG